MLLKHLALTLAALIVSAAPAAAIEQNCRFIQAKGDREACYKRQEEELAAKRKPPPTSESKTIDQLQQMRRDDEMVYRSINGICRGC
jgi:hypothetical protein